MKLKKIIAIVMIGVLIANLLLLGFKIIDNTFFFIIIIFAAIMGFVIKRIK